MIADAPAPLRTVQFRHRPERVADEYTLHVQDITRRLERLTSYHPRTVGFALDISFLSAYV